MKSFAKSLGWGKELNFLKIFEFCWTYVGQPGVLCTRNQTTSTTIDEIGG